MKKLLALLLITVLLFVAVSCAAPEVELVPDFNDGSSEASYDYSGMTFNFLTNITSNAFGSAGEALGYMQDSILGEKAMQRKKDVEDKLGITVAIETSGDAVAYPQLAAAAGQSKYDALQGLNSTFRDSMKIGQLLPMSVVSDIIDIYDAELWGSPRYYEAVAWNNDVYGVLPASWPELYNSYCAYQIAINVELAMSLNARNPREMLENGEWTRDNFGSLLKEYTVNEGETKIKGLSAHGYHFAEMVLYSSTKAMACQTTDTESGWVSSMTTAGGLEALNWMREFFFGQYKDYYINAANYESAADDLLMGRAVMAMGGIGYYFSSTSTIANEMGEIALMPFPVGGEREYGEWASCYEWLSSTLVIPTGVTDPDFSARVLYEIYQPLDGISTQEELDEYYTKYVFYNDSDYSVYKTVSENTRYTFYVNDIREALEQMVDYVSQSPTVALAAYADQLEDVMINDVKESFESMEYLFGDDFYPTK